jgi:hypothetical protein
MAADVLILGCGPAGLLAAHAVEQLGGRPHIISRKVPSKFRGAQYLHEPISDLTGDPHGVIRTFKSGTREGYAQKVYGDPAAPCSWDDQAPERDAWDLRQVYAELWNRYQSRIQDSRVTWDDLHAYNDRFSDGGDWQLVLSTLPALDSCYQRQERCGEHRFDWEAMWTLDYAPPDVADNTVLYSGDPEQFWYRTSRVFGHCSTEFTEFSPPSGGAVIYDNGPRDPTARVAIPNKGIKVKGTNCDCWPNVKRIGRFGTWRKGYLVHQAYHDAARYFEEAMS